MTQEQYEKRKERTETPALVISRTEEGFRVYSPAEPGKSYVVSGSPQAASCTCPDFQYHEGDPQWRCKHILAILSRLPKLSVAANGPTSKTEEKAAVQNEGQLAEKGTKKASNSRNGSSEMLIKRSVSPDGRIDSLSVEFSCSVEKLPVKEIKECAQKTLLLQSEIVESFLNGNRKANDQPHNNEAEANGAQPAQLLDIGGMNGKWGRRLFINVKVNGQTSKLFGNRKQLGEFIAAAGFPSMADHIDEGMPLNLACRVTTKPSEDGRFLNIERVLPLGGRR